MGVSVRGSKISKGAVCHYLQMLSHDPDAMSKLSALDTALENLQQRMESGQYTFSDDGSNPGVAEIVRESILCQVDDPELDEQKIDGIVRYLQRYWFNPKTAWWPNQQPIEPVFCAGLRKTIEAATMRTGGQAGRTSRRSAVAPIDAYWVIIQGEFQCAVTLNLQPDEVLLLFMTPPAGSDVSNVYDPRKTKIWVVKEDALDRVGEPKRWNIGERRSATSVYSLAE